MYPSKNPVGINGSKRRKMNNKRSIIDVEEYGDVDNKRPIIDVEEYGDVDNKRPIIDVEEDGDVDLLNPPPQRPQQSQQKKSKRGDDKIMEEMEKKEPSVCGVCLSEDGKAQRGKLDCCEHYFCFGCIMEWAKVESRCPMCKQRFATIFRPYKTGNGLRGRTVTVPLRDQVCQPPEEDDVSDNDPYADVYCTECNNTGDDNLLLLCDLCDSAAHTYCVGLGRTVPSGDWYCRVCEASRPRHSNAHEEEEDDEFVLDLNNDGEAAEEVSVSEIIAERVRSRPVLLPSPLSISVRNSMPSQVRRVRRRAYRRRPPRLSETARALMRQPQVLVSNPSAAGSGSAAQAHIGGARTLSSQRILQERIQVMRENWSALQSGRLQFSSRPFPCSSNGTSDGANRVDQGVPNNHPDVNRGRSSNEADVDKAWAMMEEAKSLAGCGATKKVESSNWGSSSSRIKGESSEIRHHSSSRVVGSRNSSFACSDLRASSSSAARQNNSVSNSRPQGILTESKIKGTIEREGTFGVPPVRFTLWPPLEHSTPKAMISPQVGDCQKNGNQGAATKVHQEENVERSKRISCKEAGRNVPQEISNPPNTLRVSPDTSRPGRHVNGSASVGPQCNETGVRAKDQVMSLVKIHLKPIYRSKQLGVLEFKEIARLSTHTILAACGLEHSEYRVQPFQKVHCCHTTQQFQSSSLMPGCCTECFDSFVKDLVNRILCEKLRTHL